MPFDQNTHLVRPSSTSTSSSHLRKPGRNWQRKKCSSKDPVDARKSHQDAIIGNGFSTMDYRWYPQRLWMTSFEFLSQTRF
ncbi:hypothetical protein AB1N83_011653 [Pleurotus pulmonarius]